MTACIWRGRTQPRAIRGRHLNDCESASCNGCWPCTEHHCRICGREHTTVDGRGTDQTCATCLHDVREDLGLIVTLSQRLLDEAIVKGINSEAANLAGPSIDTPEGIEAHGYRRMSAAMGRIPGIDADDRHPLWTLGTWETIAREHIGNTAVADERITVTGARAYLDRQLHILAHDPEFGFEDLAAEVRTCRGHLEDVLRDGEQVEKGAPCQKCRRPLTKTTEVGGTVYECEHCHDKLTENRYRLAVREEHIKRADRLNIDDLSERLSVPASTLRRWAGSRRIQHSGEKAIVFPPLMHSCGCDTAGRKVYRVRDALAIRDAGGDRRGSGTVSNEGVA